MLWLILVVSISTNLSSPLSPLYQAKYHLSSLDITALFAVYAVFLLPVLLASGSLEKRFGLKRIVGAAVLLDLISIIFFGSASEAWMLYAARMVEGLSLGAFMGAANALLLRAAPADKAPRAMFLSSLATTVGFGLGPAMSGFIVQYGNGNPQSSPYWIFMPALILVYILFLTLSDEKAAPRDKHSPIRIRLGIPESARPLFLKQILPFAFLLFAFNGTVIALIPTFVKTVMHSTNLAWSGLILLVLLAGGNLVLRLPWASDPVRRMKFGLTMLLVGSWGMLTAGSLLSMPLLWIGIAIQAAGSGWLFQPGIRLSGLISAPSERSQVIASFYAAAYAGMIVPSLCVGLLTQFVSLMTALFCVGGLISAMAFAFLLLSRGLSAPRLSGVAKPVVS